VQLNKGITKRKVVESNLLTDEDIENLQLAEDFGHTCVEMYFIVTSTGLGPEIASLFPHVIQMGALCGGNK
jgi:mannosyl-oligosaccharide alpha-1,2-mannosidase